MANEKITLDRLIRKIEFAEPYSCEGAGEDFGKGFKHCRKWAADIVSDNREALEAGMQKPLPCYCREYKWKENWDVPEFPTYYQAYPLTTDNKYAGFWCMRDETAEGAKKKLIKNLKTIGITAEFMDG